MKLSGTRAALTHFTAEHEGCDGMKNKLAGHDGEKLLQTHRPPAQHHTRGPALGKEEEGDG